MTKLPESTIDRAAGASAGYDASRMEASEILERYRADDVSPSEIVNTCLEQISSHDSAVNAFCLVDPDQALAQARASEQRWRAGSPRALEGIPVAIKDLFLTRGWPTRRGSKTVDPRQTWTEDAPAVARLREAGAILIGKTTTPEFGWKGVTDSPLAGATRNPWDQRLTAGGSSGGSAAAVALEMAPLALGTDGGGSIRIPAAFCGITGLKPTHGLVPLWPPPPYGTLAHAGPMARSAADAALMLDVIARPDHRDWSALPPRSDLFSRALRAVTLDHLRIAYSPAVGDAPVEPEIEQIVARAAASFRDLGAEVEEARPDLPDAEEAFSVLWSTGAAATVSSLPERDEVDPGLLEVAEAAMQFSALDHARAELSRAKLGAEMSILHQRYDLLVTPTVPIEPFGADQEVPGEWPEKRWWTWTPFTYPFNLTQQPAISVPCGFTRRGLPVGMQIVGPRHSDALVLAAAHRFQQAHPPAAHHPPAAP